MSYALRPILQVFLASPGDLFEERLAARSVVDAINRGPARQLSWYVELIGWEDTRPGFARPQELINADVDRCDLFIGALYERWGTPTGEYSSGFEEEFERAVTRRRKSGSPEIWLFFKTMDPKLVRDPGEDAQKVIAFRERERQARRLLFREFETTTDWNSLLWQYITTELTERALREAEPRSVEHQAVATGASPDRNGAVDATDGTDGTRDAGAESVDRVRSILARVMDGLPNSVQEIGETPVDLIRIHLLATAALSLNQTDELYGPHEVNLAYRYRTLIDLIDPEPLLILRTLLPRTAENVTGWFWLRHLEPEECLRNLVVRSRFDGSDDVRAGAVHLLRLSRGFPADLDLTSYLTQVLADSATPVRRAALDLLWDRREDVEDVEAILAELSRSDSDIAANARNLRLRLLISTNPQQALTELMNLDQDLDDAVKDALAAGIDGIMSDGLRQALDGPNNTVRAFAVSTLASRGELDPTIARSLLRDDSAHVREAVVVAGFTGFTRDDLEESLTDFPKAQLFARDHTEVMRRAFYRRLSFTQLMDAVDDWSLEGAAAYEVLSVNHFQSFARRIRADLADDFQSVRERWLEATRAKYGSDAATALGERYARIDNFLRSQYTLAALRGLIANPSREDAAQAQKLLTNDGLQTREAAIKLLARTATHIDATALADLAVEESPAAIAVIAATAALRVARRADIPSLRMRLWKTGDPKLIRVAFETRVTKREAAGLLAQATNLLNDDNSTVRVEAVRFIVKEVSAAHLKRTIDQYIGPGRYYYNVVTWLDRALYAPPPLRNTFREMLLN